MRYLACSILLAACGPATDIASQPVADAGFDQAVRVGAAVTLDGSLSFDPDGADLQYTWQLAEQPLGSTATLGQGLEPPNPQLVPDVAGIYLVRLVVSNGERSSRPDVVAISARNESPIAAAQCELGTGGQPDCEVLHGSTVTLVGNLSEDPEGEPLAFLWQWVSAASPAACAALCPGKVTGNPCDATPGPQLDDETSQQGEAALPNVADVDFIFTLEVSDGLTTDTDCLVYTTTNQAPAFNPSGTVAIPASPTEGVNFTLSTAVADLDPGDTVTATWTQQSPASPVVNITNNPPFGHTATAQLPLDSITQNTVFTFRVTATDGLASAFSEVNVNIQNAP